MKHKLPSAESSKPRYRNLDEFTPVTGAVKADSSIDLGIREARENVFPIQRRGFYLDENTVNDITEYGNAEITTDRHRTGVLLHAFENEETRGAQIYTT